MGKVSTDWTICHNLCAMRKRGRMLEIRQGDGVSRRNLLDDVLDSEKYNYQKNEK